jgi:hypothetical protein
VEVADSTGTVNIDYYFGRKDNRNCSLPSGRRLPDAQYGLSEISKVFVSQLGLSLHDAGKLTISSHSPFC